MYICMSDEAGRYDGQILLKICGRLLVIDNIDDDDMYIHTYIIERWGRRTLFNHQQQHLLRNIVTIGAECLGLKIFNVVLSGDYIERVKFPLFSKGIVEKDFFDLVFGINAKQKNFIRGYDGFNKISCSFWLIPNRGVGLLNVIYAYIHPHFSNKREWSDNLQARAYKFQYFLFLSLLEWIYGLSKLLEIMMGSKV